MQIIFTILATIAAVLVDYEDAETAESIFATFLGVPLLSWLILAALLCPVIRLGDWVVDITVRIVELVATAAKLDNVHYTLIGMSTALKCVPYAASIDSPICTVYARFGDGREERIRTMPGLTP